MCAAVSFCALFCFDAVGQSQIKDKEGVAIEVGDEVTTRFRGGKHEGTVRASGSLNAFKCS